MKIKLDVIEELFLIMYKYKTKAFTFISFI